MLFRQRSGTLTRSFSFTGSQKDESDIGDDTSDGESYVGVLPNIGDVLQEHHEHERGRGLTIQAGLYAGLVGHGVDDALKVVEYDEDGNEHLNVSTLDEFEQFWKPLVDVFLGAFALVNAGVRVDGIGSMTLLVMVSLIVGKFGGVVRAVCRPPRSVRCICPARALVSAAHLLLLPFPTSNSHPRSQPS